MISPPLQHLAHRFSMGLILTALVGLGCYKPNIAPGGLKCADGGICPEGFQCDRKLSMPVCVIHLSDGGIGGKGGMEGGVGGMGAGGMGGQQPSCFDAKPDCAPADDDGGICDPFCQTGCAGCREKCSVNTKAALTCNAVTSNNLKGVLDSCSISSAGLAAQADNCAPGSVCLEEECGARCYQFCRSDQDCTNAPCDRRVADGGQRICDVPFKSCTPLGGTDNTGCVGSTMACYLSSTHSDQTVCDCPFNAGGANDDCTRSRDCNAGLACMFVPAAGKSICLKVCDLMMNGNDCPSGIAGSCRLYNGASGTGTPHTRFGVCL